MKKEDLRIVFMGTPEFAVGTLSALVEGGYNVVAVVTQPDKPVGRHGSVLRAPAVKEYAQKHGIPVMQPEKMKDQDFVEQLRAYKADVQVVVAFRMLPEIVWAMPRFGTFNVHAALLPQYRGAAPINWAIINGETVTGVTTFFLDEDIDTGRIILQKKFDIPEDADVEFVYNGLMQLGANAALETIDKMIAGDGEIKTRQQDDFIEQGGELKSAPKIFKDTCKIDWNMSATDVHNFVRGLSPIPGAWGMVSLPNERETEVKIYQTKKCSLDIENAEKPGTLVKINKKCYVACGDSFLEILMIQPLGKKRMDAKSFLNGYL